VPKYQLRSANWARRRNGFVELNMEIGLCDAGTTAESTIVGGKRQETTA
jgi:hypothetical protein